MENDWLRLIGVAVVIVGLVLRLKVAPVVVTAGIVTGLAAGIPVMDSGAQLGIVSQLGKAFADQRLVTLFILSLPAIGLAERYGLQEQAGALIRRVRAATVGRLMLVYQLFRIMVAAFGIRLGSGHVAFSRPLVVPMALAAAGHDEAPPSEQAGPEVETIKAACGASENYGNFFGQNLFIAAAGVLIVVQNLRAHGFEVDPIRVSLQTLPITVASVALGTAQYALLDRWLRRRRERRAAAGRE